MLRPLVTLEELNTLPKPCKGGGRAGHNNERTPVVQHLPIGSYIDTRRDMDNLIQFPNSTAQNGWSLAYHVSSSDPVDEPEDRPG